MPRPASSNPTERELEILRVLWETGPAELGRICAALRTQREVATTTVATMLKVMREKELVDREKGARGYVWSARVTQEATGSGMLTRLIDHVFDGSAGRLVARLLEDQKLTDADRDEIRKMLGEDRS